MIDTKGLYPVAIGCTGGSGSRALREILAASPQIFMDQDCSPNSKDSQKSKTFLHQVVRLIPLWIAMNLPWHIPEHKNRSSYFPHFKHTKKMPYSINFQHK